MKSYITPIERTRNIGIAAHIDAGKTTLTERVLFYTGEIHHPGEVHDGQATTDHMDLEREKGITITAAAISCHWTQPDAAGTFKSAAGVSHRINLIDTPGHVDFTAEVERSLRVLDGAVAVFCGVAGVQPQSQRVWRQASRYGVPRLAFVNKMDRTGANFENAVEQIRTQLQANAFPVLLPLGREATLRGQIDIINQKAFIYNDDDRQGLAYTIEAIPLEEQNRAAQLRVALVENLANLDDRIAELFLNGEDVPSSELKAAIRRQTIANRFVPVIGGSAFKYRGVQGLLDAVVDYLPSPVDLPPARALASADESPVEVSPADPFCALVFKLWTDKFSRRLAFVRIYSGRLAQGDSVINATTGKRERINRLVKIQAAVQTEVSECFAGDIAAVVGLKEAATGQTLCAPERVVHLEPPSFPEPVVSMAIEPQSRQDHESMGAGLRRLMEEDPTFRVFTDRDTGQTIVAGMGELHLEVIRERLAREHAVHTIAGAPRIAYRETITREARGEGKQIKQTGGNGQYGHVILTIRPAVRGTGNLVLTRVVGGAIPREFLPACRKGVEEALSSGVMEGYPVVDVEVEITDGSFHDKDSNELAFRMAAIFAFKEAMRAASPVLLEPIMRVECTAPADAQGELIGDLARRRGHVTAVNAGLDGITVIAEAPLAAMFGYAGAIRSLSRGRADYSMAPSHFQIAPTAPADRVTE